jgi:hypothetical protein
MVQWLFQVPMINTRSITALKASSDSKIAITNSQGNRCSIWDIKTLRPINTLVGHYYMPKVLYEGKIIAGTGDQSCDFYNLSYWHQGRILSNQYENVNAIDITLNNQIAVSGSEDMTCILWNLKTGTVIKKLIGHLDSVLSIAFTPDNKKVISCSHDKTCICWDIQSGKQLQMLKGHNESICNVAVAPDGKIALVSYGDGICILWNLVSGVPIKTLIGPKSEVGRFSISPTGKKAISTYLDKSCLLWNLKTGQAINSFTGHSDLVTSAAISHDSNRAITCSRDKSCIIWELQNGNPKAIFIADSNIYASSLLREGICIGGESRKLFVLNTGREIICPGIPVATIKQIWDFELNSFTEPLIYCPLCGHCFQPPIAIIQTIFRILTEACITPDQSPCLELPDEAWENPELLGECPSCNEKLKYNPFFGSEQGGIREYLSYNERDNQYQKIYDEAEKAFNENDWENASNLYLKLVQQGKFDLNYMRYNMAICQINCLLTENSEIINRINNLISLLQEKGADEKAKSIADKLKLRIDHLRNEELLKKNTQKPWWKKFN